MNKRYGSTANKKFTANMNLFKIAYKIKRENSEEIYKAFGFKHLSDVTQYYVHPNNQSFKGTTTLCQPIGEAISLFSLLLVKFASGRGDIDGDVYSSGESGGIYLEISIPPDWRSEGIVEPYVFMYRVVTNTQRVVTFAAYTADGTFIENDMRNLLELYKLLAVFTGLLSHEMHINDDIKKLLIDYVSNPSVDTFVNIHEDFYQNHKLEEYELVYKDISGFDLSDHIRLSASYTVIRENLFALGQLSVKPIVGFAPDAFLEEYREYIPALGEEFVLPTALGSVCNAVAAGDSLATLFHGPAGTGKTISCKLICQEIGLPIMETINCTENLDEFVLGKFLPEGDKIIFRESYVTKAIRHGGAVVFEEINFAKPQHIAFLNSLLDDNGFARLDNGDVVRRSRNFRFFATMNLGYFGTKELNQALYNRFACIVEVAALSDAAIRRMLVARTPDCEPVVEKMIGVYHKLKKKIEAEELDVVISPRNLENWARLAKYEGYIRAAEKTLIPIAKCDRVLEDTIRSIIVLYKWS